MPSVAQRLRPETRNLAFALERIAAEAQALQLKGSSGAPDWKTSFVLAQRKVLDHYREVLALPGVPEVERVSILERIARVESELTDLTSRERSKAGDITGNSQPR